MASRIPAEFLRLDRELGPIAPGYRANLVLLDDRPASHADLDRAWKRATERGAVDERTSGFSWSGSATWACPTPSPTPDRRLRDRRRSASATSHDASCRPRLQEAPRFTDFDEALAATKPDVVSINTWSDTHADYAIRAMEAGAHVFVEKPLAETVADAERVVADGASAPGASSSSAISCATIRPGSSSSSSRGRSARRSSSA